MKIIKAMIKKKRTEAETGFSYPEKWDAQKINVVAYEDTDNIGDVVEYCIALIHDDEYAEQLITSSENVEEIDETTANKLGNKVRPQKKIIDNERLPEVLFAVSKPSSRRTPLEKRILDPDSNEPGIRRSPKFNVRKWFPE